LRYLGGKTRIAKTLATLIDSVRQPGQWVWDPFCGGLSMSVALSKKGPVWSTDVNPALIALYKAVQAGWEPPAFVSEEQWRAAKLLPDSNPLKAFCGFGCSFGALWFSSYMKHSPGKSEHVYTARRLKKDCTPATRTFTCIDFLSCKPGSIDAVLYLDPPYKGTAKYSAVAEFDSEMFFKIAAKWAAFTHVFISEYSSPIGLCVWSQPLSRNVGGGTGSLATERLYYLPKGSV
jgi:DNA adenine methylase